MTFKPGQWVEHDSQSWGPGRVEATTDSVTVRFAGYKDGQPVRIGADRLRCFGGDTAAAAAELGIGDIVLKHRAKKGKYPDSAEALIERFLKLFPDGFGGAKYTGDERNYKDGAVAACREALRIEELEAMLATGDRASLVRRFGLSTAKIVNLLSHRVPRAQFTDVLRREDTIEEIARRFVELHRAPNPASMNGFFRAVGAAAPRLTWQFATLLPALFEPERHVYIQPTAFRRASWALRYELPPPGTPTGESYEASRRLAQQWLERLKVHGAKDFIDVQSFMYRSQPEAVVRKDTAADDFTEED